MSDPITRTVTLQARYVPGPNGGPFTTMAEAIAAGHDSLAPETGTYQLGVVDEGVFVPFFEDAAAHIFGQIDAGKKLLPPDPPAAPVEAATIIPPATPTAEPPADSER